MYESYIRQYLKETERVAQLIDQADIKAVLERLVQVRDQGGRLFIIGVGGSAANASHAVNDFRKICKMEVYAPTDNVSELTAWTNDNGFEWIFKYWLEGSRLNSKDAVMVFSVGGGSDTTSKNITLAIEYAKEVGATVLGIVSRDGGTTRRRSDASVLIPVVEPSRITPHAEGWQGVVWHLLTNAIAHYHPTPEFGNGTSKSKAVFIDRDGVVNLLVERTGSLYPTAPWSVDELTIYGHVSPALDALGELGFARLLVTNQPDVAYGNMSESTHDAIHAKMLDLAFDDYYQCLHGRDENCDCKKPKPGMLLAAADKWNIDLKGSYMIGDSKSDMEAGRMARCKTILIENQYNREVPADYKVKDLTAAVEIIRSNELDR